jgi:phosphate transport system substrate-binding protein
MNEKKLLLKNPRAISTVAIVVVIVVIIVIAGVGAYLALTPPASSASTTSSSSSSSTTSISMSGSSTLAAASLVGAGSTLVAPAMTGWTYNFSLIYPSVRLNYQAIGSGGGISAFTAGTVQFGASDAPLSSSQYGNLSAKHPLQIPEIIGGVVPAYNLPGIKTGLKFNGSVLAQIFLGNITMWNATALQQLNPGVTLPGHQIITVHRSDGSGTTYVWTDYLSASSSTWNSTVGKSTSVSWCGSGNPSPNCGTTIISIGTKGSTGVTGYIQGNSYTLGYVETVYAAQSGVTYGAIQNSAGVFVLANTTTTNAAAAAASSYQFPSGNQSWATVSLVDLLLKNTTATNAYPLATLTYIMVYQEQNVFGTSQAQAIALATFLWWIINSAQTPAAHLGYVALPPKLVAIDDASIESMTYNGTPLLSPMMTTT